MGRGAAGRAGRRRRGGAAGGRGMHRARAAAGGRARQGRGLLQGPGRLVISIKTGLAGRMVLNPKTLNPTTLNPKTLNPKNPKP
jgi:hypothetical protein